MLSRDIAWLLLQHLQRVRGEGGSVLSISTSQIRAELLALGHRGQELDERNLRFALRRLAALLQR